MNIKYAYRNHKQLLNFKLKGLNKYKFSTFVFRNQFNFFNVMIQSPTVL